MAGEGEVRIVLVGKTGAGKSHAGNTILGEEVFDDACSANSQTQICERYEKEISGRKFIVIDTPGLFDTRSSVKEEHLKREIISSLVECAPGPHVFILVLAVERFTRENQETVEKVLEYFTGDAVHHTVLLFTHGDDLKENMTIQDFINQSDVQGRESGELTLKGLAEKCGNRVHVIDNKHWNQDSRAAATLAELQRLNLSEQVLQEIMANMQPEASDKTPWLNILSEQHGHVETGSREYRTNTYQLTQLMKSVRAILTVNNGQPYRNEALEAIGEAINAEVNNILEELEDERERENMVEIRRRAIERVTTKTWSLLTGVATGALVGALLGVGVGLAAPPLIVAGLIRKGWRKFTRQNTQAGDTPVDTAGAGIAAGVSATAGGAVAAVGTAVGTAAAGAAGFGVGLMTACDVSKRSDNPNQAAHKVTQALKTKAQDVLNTCWNLGNTDS